MTDKSIFSQNGNSEKLVVPPIAPQELLRGACVALEQKIAEIDAQVEKLHGIVVRLEEAQRNKSIQSLTLCQGSVSEAQPVTATNNSAVANMLLGDPQALTQSVRAVKRQTSGETTTLRRVSRDLCETTHSTRSARVQIKKLQIERQTLRRELASKQQELNNTQLRDASLNMLHQAHETETLSPPTRSA